MKNLSLVLLSVLPSTSLCWVTQVGPCHHQAPIASFAMRNYAPLGYVHSQRFMSKDEEMPEEMNIPASAELKTDDPCWQNFYGDDDDCGMSSVYAANFVPSKWIKSMPCGEGIEVSPNERKTFYESKSLTPKSKSLTLCHFLFCMSVHFNILTNLCWLSFPPPSIPELGL